MEQRGVQTLERALDIIELLSCERDGLGVTEIGNRLDLHKSTVHRLLTALGERGYIEQDTARKTYRLGLKFIEIGSLRLNHLELKTEAAPILRNLAENFRQPVHLAILRGSDAVYMEKIEAVTNLRIYSQIGKRIPVYCSALGKSLLMDMSPQQISSLAGGIHYEQFTDKTQTGIDNLLAAVELTRTRGWAVDDEEHETGIRCIAAPVRDYTGTIIASVSVAGDKSIISPERDAEIGNTVKNAAELISRRMGYIERI